VALIEWTLGEVQRQQVGADWARAVGASPGPPQRVLRTAAGQPLRSAVSAGATPARRGRGLRDGLPAVSPPAPGRGPGPAAELPVGREPAGCRQPGRAVVRRVGQSSDDQPLGAVAGRGTGPVPAAADRGGLSGGAGRRDVRDGGGMQAGGDAGARPSRGWAEGGAGLLAGDGRGVPGPSLGPEASGTGRGGVVRHGRLGGVAVGPGGGVSGGAASGMHVAPLGGAVDAAGPGAVALADGAGGEADLPVRLAAGGPGRRPSAGPGAGPRGPDRPCGGCGRGWRTRWCSITCRNRGGDGRVRRVSRNG